MSAIVSWEYYNSLYSKISETDFTKVESLAEKEVKLVIGSIRWNMLDNTEFYFEQLQDCICKVIDKMADMQNVASGKGISSVSNDGYSESYVLQTQSQAMAELQSCIKAWLSGTGLAGAY